MTKDFDGIGLNSMSEAETREGMSEEAWARFNDGRQEKIAVEDIDFDFKS